MNEYIQRQISAKNRTKYKELKSTRFYRLCYRLTETLETLNSLDFDTDFNTDSAPLADDIFMFIKSAEGVSIILDIFDSYKDVSNLAISLEKTKVEAVGRNITEDEHNSLKGLDTKETAIKKELKFLGHKINLSYMANDKLNTDSIAANMRKNVMDRIYKCIRNLKLTLIGRVSVTCNLDSPAMEFL